MTLSDVTMTVSDHWVGYEAACELQDLRRLIDCQMSEIRVLVGEEYYREAFRRRPCRRLLRYIGGRGGQNEPVEGFFTVGTIYRSVDFNGATYSIEGYSDVPSGRVIGCSYFVIVGEAG